MSVTCMYYELMLQRAEFSSLVPCNPRNHIPLMSNH